MLIHLVTCTVAVRLDSECAVRTVGQVLIPALCLLASCVVPGI